MAGNTPYSKARFIPSEELPAGQVRVWRFGDVGLGGLGGEALPSLDTSEQLHPLMSERPSAPAMEEAPQAEDTAQEEVPPEPPQPAGMDEETVQHLLEQARQEAYQQGLEQGHQQAAQEWQQRMQDYQNNQGREQGQRLAEIVHQAQNGIQGLQQQIAPDLLQLACDIARQVVRQELRTNPQALMPVLREALDMLGAETKPAVVRLHPQDWQVLEPHIRAALSNPKIEWLQDASVQPGGCLVESQGAQVDGSLEKRWQRAVAALGLVSTWYEGAQHG